MTTSSGVTRRQALRNLAIAGAGVAGIGGAVDELVARAVAASPKHGSMADIEHVVILIQENRSFDHYFGTYPGVRGFGDVSRDRSVFYQRGLEGRTLHPFHFKTNCIADLTHDWQPQHLSWNNGRMNGFLEAHETFDAPINGVSPGPETMGYYTGEDLPFYFGLAEAFTICDGYHCSVIGPTDPNRLMSMSASIDPAGTHGGPLVQTNSDPASAGLFSWTTMPERLSARGVSWKVYTGGGGGVLDNVLTYFKQYRPGSKLYDRGLAPTYPADFLSDLADDRLPKVSWLLRGLEETEHPGFSSPHAGELGARQVVETSIAHPKIWRKTALFITWDENGGFFDHVTPPTAPPGTPGEYLTAPGAARGRGRDHRADRARLPRPDAGRFAVLARRARELGRVRPHVDAAVRRDAVRCRRPEPQRLAAQGDRRSDQHVQLRRQPGLRTAVATAPGRGDDVRGVPGDQAHVGVRFPSRSSSSAGDRAGSSRRS